MTNKAIKLRFFDNPEAVVSYLTSELIATLQDDFHNNPDERDLKDKIHDIEAIADRLTVK